MLTDTVYFCDFDGTISRCDVTDSILERFALPGWAELNDDFAAMRIGSKEAIKRQYDLVRGSREDIEAFILGMEIDPTFVDFVNWTRGNGTPLIILSDGLDLYIDLLFEKYGIKGILYFANRAWFEGNRIKVDFPHYHAECPHGCHCGNCKPSHMADCEGKRRVYIGDGYSDRFGASISEVVYAKSSLALHCTKESIPYNSFKDFSEIIDCEQKVFGTGNPAKKGD